MAIHTIASKQTEALDLLKKEVKEMQEVTLIALEEAEKNLDLVIASSDDYFIHPNKYALQVDIPKTITFSTSKIPLANSIHQIQ